MFNNEQCKHCLGPEHEASFFVSGYVATDRIDNINMSAFLHWDTLIFSANFMTLEATINFCPMCGRKLTPSSLNEDCEQGGDAE